MIATLNLRQISPDKLDAVTAAYRDVMAPHVRAQKGNKGAFALANRATGKVIGVALWETEADMRAASANLPSAVDEASGVQRVVEVYEVIVAPGGTPGG